MRRPVALAVGAILTLTLGACGGDDNGVAADSTTSGPAAMTTTATSAGSATTTGAAPTSAASTSPATTAPCPESAGSSSSAGGAAPSDTMLLTALDAEAAGACRDRVTFTFRSSVAAPPGYRAEYQPGPFVQGGSGAPISVAGSDFLVVRFEPAATADLTQESAPETYTGPDSVIPEGAHHVREIRLVDAFEGVVTWVIGLDAEYPFRVAAAASPPALEIVIG